MTFDNLKRQAAEKAVESVTSGMVVGLGTGSTAVHAVRTIGRFLQDGRLQDIVAIPTSKATAQEARAWHIPLTTFAQHPIIDLTIDGMDEVDPQLNLIKGLGGALLHEKIVATASRRFIVVGDHRKRVSQLGTRAPIPVEVIPFAQYPVTSHLETLGGDVSLRVQGEKTFFTDEGNIILDCYFASITTPHQLAEAIRMQPGVVEHGLFLGLASQAILATPQGIDIINATSAQHPTLSIS